MNEINFLQLLDELEHVPDVQPLHELLQYLLLQQHDGVTSHINVSSALRLWASKATVAFN